MMIQQGCFQTYQGFALFTSIAIGNVTVAKAKWSHILITTFSLQLFFCRCLSAVITSFTSAKVIYQSVATIDIKKTSKRGPQEI